MRNFTRKTLGFVTLLVLTVLSLPAYAAPGDFRDLAKTSRPAVVNISTERTAKVPALPPGFEMFRNNPFFEQFDEFHNFGTRERKQNSLGSGFIISPDGYVVTNNHVVEGADSIKVSVSRGEKEEVFEGQVVGTDPDTDIALLKIKADGLPVLKFGDSDALEVGEWVLAIGSPLGLDHTVTAGIVSAKGRNIQSGSYDDFLQTDASINRGNSGGPLLNMAGEVIGINTAIAQRAQGIGFAIPSNMAVRIITALKDHKKVSRGWLGVTIQNLDAATAKALDMKEPAGALVNSVLEGQPADKAGVKAGDVILSVNGESVKDTDALLRKVAMLAPGSEVKLALWREGKETTVSVTVAERDAKAASGKGQDADKTDAAIGLKVRPLTKNEERQVGLEKPALVVTAVENDGPADKTGMKPGDLILFVDRKPVTTPEEFFKIAEQSMKTRGVVLLQVMRRDQMFFVAVEAPKK